MANQPEKSYVPSTDEIVAFINIMNITNQWYQTLANYVAKYPDSPYMEEVGEGFDFEDGERSGVGVYDVAWELIHGQVFRSAYAYQRSLGNSKVSDEMSKLLEDLTKLLHRQKEEIYATLSHST